MNGEFSRLLFDRSNDYTGVLMQQGRVLVDAEWNEHCAILNEQLRRAISDLTEQSDLRLRISGLEKESGSPRRLRVRFPSDLRNEIFYVDGVRCRLGRAPGYVDVHPMDVPINLASQSYVISVHAWERTVAAAEDTRLEDPALQGADSALRTKIAWELQVDRGEVTDPRQYLSWINKRRGALKTRHVGPHNAAPSLYRIEITSDGSAGGVTGLPNDVAEFAWARENTAPHRLYVDEENITELPSAVEGHRWLELITPSEMEASKPGRFIERETLGNAEVLLTQSRRSLSGRLELEQYLRCWDGHGPVIAPDNGGVKLDGRVEVQFHPGRKFRSGECWLVPYRGTKDLDEMWLMPSGQHYFAQVMTDIEVVPTVPKSVTPPDDSPEDMDRPQIDPRLVNHFLSSSADLPRSLAANALADETENLWLKKWLGTALLSEVVKTDFSQFWQRLITPLPSGVQPDRELRNEAMRIWATAQELDLALQEKPINTQLKTIV